MALFVWPFHHLDYLVTLLCVFCSLFVNFLPKFYHHPIYLFHSPPDLVSCSMNVLTSCVQVMQEVSDLRVVSLLAEVEVDVLELVLE